MVTVKREKQLVGVSVQDMRDGEIAEIVAWTHSGPIGNVVQRCGDLLISLGMGMFGNWDRVLTSTQPETIRECRVKILEPGTELIV